MAAINKRDVDALAATMHDQSVGFGALSPFPNEDKAAIRRNWQAIFTNNESVNLTPINPQYRVIGNTGVAWGHAAFTVKPKDGPATTTFNRYTITYVKVDGKWLSVVGHVSLMPAGR